MKSFLGSLSCTQVIYYLPWWGWILMVGLWPLTMLSFLRLLPVVVALLLKLRSNLATSPVALDRSGWVLLSHDLSTEGGPWLTSLYRCISVSIIWNRSKMQQVVNLASPSSSQDSVIVSFKGQLISECLFDALNFPKNHRKIWQISAQEHERCWNHQNKDNALYYYNLHMIIWTI